MDCKQAKSMFSTYLDGAVSGHEMRAISLHMEKCGDCHTSYLSLQRTQALLSSLGTRKAPSDLPLRLKVAIQQERSRSMARTWQNIGLRIEHALNSFMLPATAGLVTAVIMFGVLIGFFALPEVANDIPTSLYTPPRLAAGPYEIQGIEGPVLIEANVDSTGRVLDYRILSGHDSDTVRVKIDKSVAPLPADTTLRVRPKSPLGLKYVQLTRGRSHAMLPENSTLSLAHASKRPVEIDDFFNIYNAPTRAGSRTQIDEFGTGLAGRGPALNDAIAALPHTVRVASGVTSRAEIPVPPVVTTRRALRANSTMAFRIAP